MYVPYDMRPPASTMILFDQIAGSRFRAASSANCVRYVVNSGVSMLSRAPAPLTALKAASKSSGPRTAAGLSCNLRARAASSVSLRCTGSVGCAGCVRTATCFSVGTSSRSSSRRLVIVAPALTVTPVMLPPGRARLLISPISTGWLRLVKTMGMDVVAVFAAMPRG